METKSRKCWIAVNKNGFICTFTDQPIRNEETGKWNGNYYVDSIIYKIIKDLVIKSKMNWNNEPEFFEFTNA